MAESLDVDTDTQSHTDTDPSMLTMVDVLHMNVDQLRDTLESLGLPYAGKTKASLQMQLIQNIPPASATKTHVDDDEDVDDVEATHSKFESTDDKKLIVSSDNSDVSFKQQLKLIQLE